MERQIFELQPLRIHSGWKVEFNDFTEYDLSVDDKSLAHTYLIEDLLQLSFTHKDNSTILLIDLGWYPDGDTDGSYKLYMIKDYNWDAPLEAFETKQKAEIISRIEYWVCYGFFNKYLN